MLVFQRLTCGILRAMPAYIEGRTQLFVILPANGGAAIGVVGRPHGYAGRKGMTGDVLPPLLLRCANGVAS